MGTPMFVNPGELSHCYLLRLHIRTTNDLLTARLQAVLSNEQDPEAGQPLAPSSNFQSRKACLDNPHTFETGCKPAGRSSSVHLSGSGAKARGIWTLCQVHSHHPAPPLSNRTVHRHLCATFAHQTSLSDLDPLTEHPEPETDQLTSL